jgi:chaperonin GroES
MNAIPLFDNVIVLQDEGVDKVGSLFIAENARVKPRQGTVMAIGDGAVAYDNSRIPLTCEVGDKVIYGEYSGKVVMIEGKEYIVLKESEILLILE